MIKIFALLVVFQVPAFGETTEPQSPASTFPAVSPRKTTAPLAESFGVDIHPVRKPKNWLRTALLWDVEHWNYTAGYDRAVSSHVAYGLKFDMFDPFNVNANLDGYGLLLTRTFFTLPNFSGVAGQIAAGTFFFRGRDVTSGVAGQGLSFIVEVSASWRFQLAHWLGWGFQFGMRYVTRPDMGSVAFGTFHPIRGSIGTELALRF